MYNNIIRKFKFLIIDEGNNPIVGKDFFKVFEIKQIQINALVSEDEKLKTIL